MTAITVIQRPHPSASDFERTMCEGCVHRRLSITRTISAGDSLCEFHGRNNKLQRIHTTTKLNILQ
jgi:hypothetical protein